MAQSDSEVESVHSQASIGSPSQKFTPEDDDEETLWEVEAITAEKGNQYKVKWVGLDPMTNKPWAQSWVPKKDCTPDLVMMWKLKKKEAERRKSTASNRGRSSTATRKGGRASTASTVVPKASTSKLSDTRRSTSATRALANGEVATSRRGRSSGIPLSTTSTIVSPDKTKGKRTKSKSKSERAPDPIPEADTEVESEEEVVPAASKTEAKNKATNDTTTITKGKKRKLDEAQSANNSARAPTVDININGDDDKAPISKRVASRPKKKRKIEVDIIEPKVEPVADDDDEEETEAEAEEPRRSVSLSQSTRRITLRQEEEEESEEEESYPARRLHGKVNVPEEDEEMQQKVKQELHSDNEGEDLEEEEEVRMVEEVLSEGIGTPPPTDYRDKVDVNMSNDERDTRKSRVDESEIPKTSGIGKSAVAVSSSSKPIPKSTNARTSSSHKVGPPSRKPLPTAQAGPSAPGIHDKPKSKNNAQNKSTTLPLNAKPTNSPPKVKLQHMQANTYPRSGTHPNPYGLDFGNKGHRGRNTGSGNTSESNDDDDLPPPLFYPSTPPSSEGKYTLPMAEKSVFWEDRKSSEINATFEDRENLPIEERLMPEDIARLKQFDDEMKILSQLSKKRERPAKDAHDVQGSSKDAVLQAPRRADVQPTAASSSKGKEKAEIIIIDKESEQDEKPTVKKTTSLINKSSAPTRDSSSKQIEKIQRREPQLADPAPAAHEREVEEADTRSIASKASKKTASSSNLKSSVVTATNGTKQRSTKPPTNSYEHETIPETEVEQSQSQEKQKTKGLDIDLSPPEPTMYPTLLHPPPPSTPGGRSTLKSKMRPKTPSSRTSSLSATGKPLGPIRMLSPSVFQPHLPRIPEPTSSLPESISDVVDSTRHPSSKISTQVDDEDVQMESIEEFESPEKPARSAAGPRTKLVASDGRHQGSAEQVWDSDVVKRGQEIAEAAKRRPAFEAGVSETRPKKTLDDIRAAHSRSNSNASNISEMRPLVRAEGLVQETIIEEDEDIQDVSTAALPPGSGPRVVLEDDNATLREMEAYVDLSGGAGAENDNTNSTGVLHSSEPHIALRQEEEESTQEAMQAMMDDVVFQASKATSSEDAVAQLALDSAGASNDGGSEHIPTIVVQDASRPASPRPYSDDGSKVGNMRTTRSRSRSQTPALVPRTTKSGGKGKAKATSLGVVSNKTSRAGSLASPEKAPSPTSQHHDEDAQARLNSALTMVGSKSQELKKLEAGLVSQQIKDQEELERLRALTIKQQAEITFSITQFADAQKEWKSQVAEAEAKSAQRLAQKEAEWEAERARLVAQFEAATKSKESADKDSDFFREQYAQASGYVTAVRDENKELGKRIKIAEDQAQSGVKLIKATFETRVQNLETDLKSWRRMAEFLIEKDRRTDNDELRRRAAEYPELASLCDRQRRTVNDLEEQIEDLREEADIRNRELETDKSELERWKKETTRLMIELSEAQNKLKRIAEADDHDESGDTSANEFVYPCQWRIYDGAESTSCNEFFSTISELEQHLLSGDHLHT